VKLQDAERETLEQAYEQFKAGDQA